MSPPSFPRTFPCSGAPFPPRGPSGWFPRFLGTVKHSDFLPPLPRCFVSFAARYRRCALGFAPADTGAASAGQGIVYRIPHNRLLRRRRQDLPGSWRTLYERAMLSDPGGTSALGHYRASVLSFANWKASTPTTNTNFGAQSHGPHTRCLRFAGWITPPPRKTRFRRLANLTGRDWLPAGPHRKVSGHTILLSQASPGAPKSAYRTVPSPAWRPEFRQTCRSNPSQSGQARRWRRKRLR